jgi:hypothetical protein
MRRALHLLLLLAGCQSEPARVADLSTARDLAIPDIEPPPPEWDLSIPDDLSTVQPLPVPDGGIVLAPPGDTAQNQAVDGITCDTNEQLLFHIHAHLQMFVNGQERLVAAGVGIGPPLQEFNGIVIGGSCFSWLHTHDESGIIHIESPVMRTFTLGNFFDIWGFPLSSTQVGPAAGSVTAFVGGTLFTGDPRTIPLNAYAVIQLDVGDPLVAAQPYTWPPGY